MGVAEKLQAAFELGGEVGCLEFELAEFRLCLRALGCDACLFGAEFGCADCVGIERFK
ncbi:hypothetical protein ACIGKQ_07015 [Gordonia sp. NPDC062954]|uniref:hypothetical protein n=1 Tax=Gordonia sp. NPDC062954 TaxID=3364003 RepID=UPI0037C6DD6B